MSDRLLLGTKKGLFELRRGGEDFCVQARMTPKQPSHDFGLLG